MSVNTSPTVPAATTAALRDQTVAVIGFGNQGAAHALNLRDSGVTVEIGARAGGAGAAAALRHGFNVRSLPEAASIADLLIIALPDEIHGAVFQDQLAASIRPGTTIGFLHGFSVHYGEVKPPDDCGLVLVAPKGPGTALRARYERGEGLPCLLAVERGGAEAEGRALAWATGIGAGRAAIVRTTFAHETETDLFGEQVVLCGGLTELVVAAFETLVNAGYPADLAYMECCQEVKQVADLVYERGLAGMMKAISNTAEFGAYHAGPDIVDAATRERLAACLAAIKDGRFAHAFCADDGTNRLRQRANLAAHPIESAGETVRDWMPWLEKPKED